LAGEAVLVALNIVFLTVEFHHLSKGEFITGEFHYPFTGGFLNTDWDKVYFAFTTQDQSGTYYHSGYVEGNKVYGITLNEGRGFVLPWKGERK